MLGPGGNGVTQSLADDALEILAILGAVQMSQDVVEGSILKDHDHYVIECVGPLWSHQSPLDVSDIRPRVDTLPKRRASAQDPGCDYLCTVCVSRGPVGVA